MSFHSSSSSSYRGGGGGGGGAGIIVLAVGGFAAYGIISNFPAILAGAFLVASGLWTLVASIAVGAAWSFPIVFLGIPVGDLGFPALNSAISGIIAGALIAWLRMVFRVKERREPFLSAMFSANIFSEGGWQFFWRFLSDVAVGYLVMFAFGMIHVVVTTDADFTLTVHQIGGALVGFGGDDGGGGGVLSIFVLVLAAIFFAAILIGAIWGAGLGSVLGMSLWAEVVHGTAQGATVQLLLGFRRTEPKHFIRYVLLGALSGAVEGALVGILCGCAVDWNYFF
jgi:hypothetical protein